MKDWRTLIKEKEFNDLLMDWNKKLNLISRRKTDVFDLIEDSKLFFGAIGFKEGVNILDLGTGGGFPGIVIAIHHPKANLTLVDSIQKKINVVNDVVKKLSLSNVKVICSRAEELSKDSLHYKNYNYIVARSVAVLQDICKWSKGLIKPGGVIIAVKGGNITGEINVTRKLKFVKSVEIEEIESRKIITVRII